MFNRHRIYDRIAGTSFEAIEQMLRSPADGRDPFLANLAAAMIGMLAATSPFLRALEGSMPQSLRKVDKDVLALDVLAYVTCSMQRALQYHHRKDRSAETERAWLNTTSSAKLIKDQFSTEFGVEIGEYWIDRWREFRATEDPHQRFNLMTYLLFTSKGHRRPQRRYPGAPPVALDLALGIEGMAAELACGEVMLAQIEAFKRLGAFMTDAEDGDEEDDEDP